MGPGSCEVTDAMGGVLLEAEKILGHFWTLQIKAAIQLKAEWAAAFLKDFMRQGRNCVSPGLFTIISQNRLLKRGSKSEASLLDACTWKTEWSFLFSYEVAPCVIVVGFLQCPQLFQLKSCEFPSNWQSPNFTVGSWHILHQLWNVTRVLLDFHRQSQMGTVCVLLLM